MSKFSRLINRPYARKELKEIDKFWEDAWFKPKYRHDLVKTFTKLKKGIEESWEMNDEELKENNLDRETMVGLAESSAKYLTKLADMEQKMLKAKQFKNHSYLYRFPNQKKLLMVGESYDVNTEEIKPVTWVMPQGWPRFKPVIIKRYLRVLPKPGYQQEKPFKIESEAVGFQHLIYRVTLKNTKFTLEARFLSQNRIKMWRKRKA
jgi:hypothetical protein